MRPVRLELEGFTAFRDHIEVDFTDADLFALVGATGSGKTSLVDAICFALYGSVPRLDRRSVEPVISSGRIEARIRFDFTVGDRSFTAARVVRRQPRGGATTKEARLEDDLGTILAGDAEGVTRGVEGLLGLGFDQFTKSVVLPQGDFARFLHDTPAGRQELLVRLLDLEVYRRMREAARTREAAADTKVQLLDARLAELAAATAEALQAAAARVALLTDLREECERAQTELDDLAKREAEARTAAHHDAEWAQRLAGLRRPADVAALAEQARTAAATLAAAQERATAAEQAVAHAERAVDALPARAVLEGLTRSHTDRATLRARIDKGKPILTAAAQAEQGAADVRDKAKAALADAQAEQARVVRDHAAHALAATLVAGQPCPVCRQDVAALPATAAPADLDAAAAAVKEAQAAGAEAERELERARAARNKADQTMADLHEQLEAVDAALDGQPDAGEVQRLLAALADTERALRDARQGDRDARAALRAAQDAARQAHERRDGAWGVFDTARDAFASLAPPPVDRADLTGSWNALVGWAETEAAARRQAAERSHEAARAAAEERRRVEAGLAGRCADAGVEIGKGRPRDTVADALAAADSEHKRVAAAIEQAKEHTAERERQAEQAAVARSLAGHLSARGFERWLLDEALEALADGASERLRQLSSEQYSLAVDAQRNFAVVDHRNADERRSARTLSGGETFLASLALALTLAEHLAALSADTEPRLESIFLDEGFGTLDADALDIVAASIEELGARGRTVGLVTHVRELAERVPVRFEVRKTPAGSMVQRVTV